MTALDEAATRETRAPDGSAGGTATVPAPPVAFLGAVAAMVLLDWIVPGPELVPRPWRWLGLGAVTAGVGLHRAARDLLRRHDTTARPSGRPSALVTRGPFAYTRNPMYLGGVLILLGLAMFFGSAAPFLVAPAFAGLVHARYVPPEEARMAWCFGREYDAYRERVRRWL